MEGMRNNFDSEKPYRIVAVHFGYEIKFKIVQPFKFYIIGYSINYYPVMQWRFRHHSSKYIMYFNKKEEVDKFIENNTIKTTETQEYIVFDSLVG